MRDEGREMINTRETWLSSPNALIGDLEMDSRFRGNDRERRETRDESSVVHRPSSVRMLFVVALFCTLLPVPCPLNSAFALETSDENTRTTLMAPLLWRAGGEGDSAFKNIMLSDASISKEGSVVTGDSAGFCELEDPAVTEGTLARISATWVFTGEVTLEVSATGNTKDYVRVTNGVPLQLQERARGSRIKWRATLAPKSVLSQVRIAFADLSGVAGSFGNELLSGFQARKQIFVKGSKTGDLFQYPVSVKVGESAKSPKTCELKLNGGVLADFKDVRFTLADEETVVPHFLESVDGKAPNRAAIFWVKVPEIPADGLFLYMYFSRRAADDISNGEKVFDLFEDFDNPVLDPKKWKVTLGDKTGKAYTGASSLFLEKAKITTAQYEFANGLLEYKARVAGSGAVAGILRETAAGNNDLVAYASTLNGSEHALAKGGDVTVNDRKPITPGVFYLYRIHANENGDLVFQRYAETGEGEAQAEVKYASERSLATPVGLSSSNQEHAVECSWIRTRRSVDPAPQVDREKTAAGILESVDLPEFNDIVTAPDGGLVTKPNASEGSYVSKLIAPGFAARILKATWLIEEPARPFWKRSEEAGEVSVSISTKKNEAFVPDWENGVSRYVSKKEFDPGGQLRWKVTLSGQTTDEGRVTTGTVARGPSSVSQGLKKFSLEYYPGTIRVVLPKGNEILAPGKPYTIFWDAPGFGSKYPMEIAYSEETGGEFQVIASKTDNTGDYKWEVPDEAVEKAAVKVTDYYDRTIFGVSEDTFSIAAPILSAMDSAAATGGGVATSSSEANASSPERNAAKTKKGKKDSSLEESYDLLVKKGSVAGEDGYKEGDIVMVQPEGYLWGASERANYTIVRANLTQAEAEEYMKSEETVDRPGKKGRSGKGKVRGGRYKLDLHQKDFLQEEAPEAKRVTRAGPLINKKAIVKQ